MEARKYNTKSVVEAGLISAIIVILMLITGYVPMMSFMGTLILPVPVAVLYIRHNLKITISAIVVSSIITAVLFNPVQALLSAISFGLTGLALGYSIRKDKSSNYTLVLLSLMALITTVLTVIITAALIQNSSVSQFIVKTINEINATFTESMNMAKGFYTNAGIPAEQIKQLDAVFSMFTTEYMMNSLVALLVIGSVFSAFMNYITAKAILKRLGYNMKKGTPFTEIYIPSFLGALIVLPVPLGVYLKAKNFAIGNPILTSGQLIMSYAFLIAGISVATYFLKNRFRLTNVVTTLIIVFIGFNPVFSTVLIYLGLADMIFDFRKINPNRILRR